MVFSKNFPRELKDGSTRWEEIFLSVQEEREREQVARQENLYLVRQCIADARNVLKDEKMMDMQSHVLSLAMTLFKKRASHAVHYKDELCKKKFQKYWGKKFPDPAEERSDNKKVKKK
ncbi:MAG: hypothetical protein ABIA62_04740 [Candidatus Woesearchaeota archaeon]